MLSRKIVMIIVALAVFVTPAVLCAQESARNSQKSESLLGQLDKFGKKILDGLMPEKTPNDLRENAARSNHSYRNRFSRVPTKSDFNSARTGSVLDRRQEEASLGRTLKTDEELSAVRSERHRPAMDPAIETLPLHERLLGISHSPFSEAVPQQSSTPPPVVDAADGGDVKAAAAAKRVLIARKKQDRSPAGEHDNSAQSLAETVVEAQQPSAASPQQQVVVTQRAGRADSANEKEDVGDALSQVVGQPTLAPKKRSPATTKSRISEPSVSARPIKPTLADKKPGGGEVLFERRSPMLNVRTTGPRRVIVNKESTYTVYVDNLGQAEAADVAVVIALPEWAHILGVEPSQGVTRSLRAENGQRQYDWRVGKLAAGSSEQIALRIVPRQSRPIELGVRWTFKPAVSHTVIEVQEPKLELHLIGPREVPFGKSQKYKLEIANSGNGLAEDVAITLMPVSAAAGLPSTHRLGALPAGKKIALQLALTARQKNALSVKVDLHNEGKLCARLNEKILVRKAELQMVADGPSMQYVGTVAAYRIRLRNTGNAEAKNVSVTARVPSQAKYLAASSGGKSLRASGKVVWSLPELQAGKEKILELQCELLKAGFNRIDVETTADDRIRVSTAAGTHVEAMADLRLEVIDPAGPVPVGNDAVYQLRIRNRGSKRAEDVEAVAYFSQGIEPVSASGAEHTLGPGQVIFHGIDAIEAGKQVILKITARADTPGNHMFRAEVCSEPLDTKLVSEETTYFFNGTLVASRPTLKRQSLKPVPAAGKGLSRKPQAESLRTADRRNSWTSTSAATEPPQDENAEKQTPTIAPRYRLQRR